MKMHDMTKYKTKDKTQQRRENISHSRKWQESELQLWQLTCGVLQAHLLLLVADARKMPGTRAVQEREGEDEEQGDAMTLVRSMSCSEENDSSH